MKLYGSNGGLFPPRVSIYLAEKGITRIDKVALDLFNWPPPEMERLGPLGTIPILEADDGTLIRSSLAILEFLEERFPDPDMLGPTPEARGETRVLVSVIEEATTQFAIWCHKGSAVFADREPQHAIAAQFAADAYFARLRKLDALVAETGEPFLRGDAVTVADCVAMATLQFSEGFYSVPVPRDCPHLLKWYAMFSARPSAVAPVYPDEIVARARLPTLGSQAA